MQELIDVGSVVGMETRVNTSRVNTLNSGKNSVR